jgi:drug/metabolite transporter (DMT)-like permease
MMLILSGVTWVSGAFISKYPRIHEDLLMSSGMQMMCGGAVMMLIHFMISAFTGNYRSMASFSSRSLLALIYLIIFGSLVAYSSFLWLMRVQPANRVATHAFVNPVVAVFLGWFLGGERLTMSMLIATAPDSSIGHPPDKGIREEINNVPDAGPLCSDFPCVII